MAVWSSPPPTSWSPGGAAEGGSEGVVLVTQLAAGCSLGSAPVPGRRLVSGSQSVQGVETQLDGSHEVVLSTSRHQGVYLVAEVSPHHLVSLLETLLLGAERRPGGGADRSEETCCWCVSTQSGQ